MILGIQPFVWTNDDFPEIGGQIPYQVILDRTRETDFAGGATCHTYPAHLPSLRHAFESRGLRIASILAPSTFTSGTDIDAALAAFKSRIELAKAVGVTDIIVAEVVDAVGRVRTKSVLNERPILNDSRWCLLTSGLDRAGALARANDVQLNYHPYVGTCVQTRAETERLLDSTSAENVSFCLDTGHLRFGGARQDDIEQLTEKYLHRIKCVHLKNVRATVLSLAVSNRYSFYQAIQCGIFTVPGDPAGEMDFRKILETLRRAHYNRWLVIEAEQNPVNADPLLCAQLARTYLKKVLGF